MRLCLSWILLVFHLVVGTLAIPDLKGRFVPFSQLSTCPDLPARASPTSSKDVRPDDLKTLVALGDSITAGFLAHPYPPPDPESKSISDAQRPYSFPRIGRWSTPIDVQEYRGLSYPLGADVGAVTFHNILSRWTSVVGGSKGHRVPKSCFDLFGWVVGFGGCATGKGDGLNGAVSGSTSGKLVIQVKESIVPALEALQVNKDDWAFVNIGIGANDICAFCLTPNITAFPLVGTPQDFARGIKEAVELLRDQLPKLIVNIIGVLPVSAIYDLTLEDPYCQGPLQPPIIPHLPLECSCALLPGPLGEVTRRKMDLLGDEYDRAVLGMIKDWEEEGDPTFGAIWQPGSAIDLANWPIEALSPVDCFHPSAKAHERVAAGFWNRLTLSMEEKAKPVVWEEEEVMVRCLEEGDRFPIGKVGVK
ncbi:hypothetical protein BCR39DRAFT_560553 [Naematelia encephala]|uniref:SGNH hydrolase-type esterase domain-containing protein n=1 Tax=Naematelia encephala TaxID=71784 RepID=A0A1Y2AWA2_9TREE|nr:hypothetical protein BCR39DRAFT_560553 [Naematelia encephala]